MALSALFVACDDSTGPKVRAGFAILERPRSTDGDTVDTRLTGELVLLLHDSTGHPRPNTNVLVQGAMPAGVPFTTPLARFRSPTAPSDDWSGWFASLTTDAEGIVRAEVALGQLAGEVLLELRASAPGFAAIDTIAFTVNPGAPARLAVLPRDSAIYVGRSYALRMRVLDRYGNLRAGDEPTASTGSAAISVTGAGVLTGVEFGRATVHARLGDVEDSALVSVVPRGVIVSTRSAYDGRPAQLLQFELDGSGFQVLADRQIERPTWSSTGTMLTFLDHGGVDDRFYAGRPIVRLTTGEEWRLLPGQVETEIVEAPRFSHDDAWVYFAGGNSWGGIMRVRTEGGTPEMVVARDPDGYGGLHDPAPSPDGRYLAYVAFANCCDVNGVRILDLETGETAQGPYLFYPRWLPGGTILGHREYGPAALVEVNPDGSLVRELALPFLHGASPFDISADGRWLLISTDIDDFGPRLLVLYELETGLTLPLGYSHDYGAPAWKP